MAAAQPATHKRLASDGDKLSDGSSVSIHLPSRMVLSDTGTMIFTSGSTVTSVNAAGTTSILLKEGSAAPGSRVFDFLDPTAMTLNSSGDMLFTAWTHAPPDSAEVQGLFFRSGNRTYLVANHGDALPGGGTIDLENINYLRVSNNGRYAAFVSWTRNGGPTQGLYQITLTGTTLSTRRIAAFGDSVDGVSFSYMNDSVGAVNNSGNMVLCSNGNSRRSPVLFWDGSALKKIASDAVDPQTLMFGDDGKIACNSSFNLLAGLSFGDAGSLARVITPGVVAGYESYSSLGAPVLSRQDDIVFLATGSKSGRGLFRYNATSGVTKIAALSDLPAGSKFSSDPPVPVPGGKVYFSIQTGTPASTAIYVGDGISLTRLIGTGDTLDGEPVEAVYLNEANAYNVTIGNYNPMVGQDCSNAAGKIVYVARTTSRTASPYRVYLYSPPTFPEIAVQDASGADLASGATADFGSVDAESSSSLTFTIRNSGNEVLTGVKAHFSTEAPAGYAITAGPAASVAPGGSTTITVRFAPGEAGVYPATLQIESDDQDESRIDLSITGTAVSPAVAEIAIEQPSGVTLVDGSAALSFGTLATGSSSTLSLTIQNKGLSALTGIAASIDGANAGDFSIASSLPASIPALGAASITLKFAPGVSGTRAAALHLASNDADESPFDIALTGASVAAEISVEQPAGKPLVDGTATASFGTVGIGSSSSMTFTIRNAGSDRLTDIVPSIVGANAADFRIATVPATSLDATKTTTVVVSFKPSADGLRLGTLLIASNDADENPFHIALSGNGAETIGPEIGLTGPDGASLVDGSSSVGFGNVPLGGNASLTFTIHSTGTVALAKVAAALSGANAKEFTLTVKPAKTVAVNGQTLFTIRFAPKASGIRVAALKIASTDANENPFDIVLQGTAVAPEIAVEQVAGVGLTDAKSTVNFGNVTLGSNAALSFTIHNTGTAPLTGISAAFTGGKPLEFAVAAPPTSSVVPGGSTTLTVRFTPTAKGKRTTKLQIRSNDADESIFDINLTGTALAAVAGPQAQGAGLVAFTTSAGLSGPAAAAEATPYNDGVSNLLKYAFNMDLSGPDRHALTPGTGASGLPACILADGGPGQMNLHLEFVRRTGSELIYTPCFRTDLSVGDWVPIVNSAPQVSAINADWERVIYEVAFDTAAVPNVFIAVRVSTP